MSGPETKNLNFLLSAFYSLASACDVLNFIFWKKLKTGEVRFIRVIKEKKNIISKSLQGQKS